MLARRRSTRCIFNVVEGNTTTCGRLAICNLVYDNTNLYIDAGAQSHTGYSLKDLAVGSGLSYHSSVQRHLFIRTGACGILFSAALFSQVAPTSSVELSGIVSDSTTGQPIANSRVSLTPGRMFREQVDVPGSQFVTTTPDGRFSTTLSSGPYAISAAADGYMATTDLPLFVSIRHDQSVIVKLTRPSRLSGRVVDAASGKGIPEIKVEANLVEYLRGEPVERRSYSATADKGGAFEFHGLLPGRYMFKFLAKDAEEVIGLATARDDAPAPDKPQLKYGQTWWPVGPTAGYVLGFMLAGGDDVRIGDVKLSKRALFSATGTFNATGCSDGDVYTLDLSRFVGANTVEGPDPIKAACGTKFTARNLSPGEYYELSAEPSPKNSELAYARERIIISDRDIRHDLIARPAIRINGKIEFPDGFRQSRTLLTMASADAERVSMTPGAIVSGDGTFAYMMVPGATGQFNLSLPERYFISSATYAGQPIRDLIVTANPLATSSDILIKVAASGATVQGTVKDKGEPVPRAIAVLMPWPIRLFGNFPICLTAPVEDGAFRFAQLPPDSYRLIVVEEEAWNTELQRPGVLDALAASGASVDTQEHQNIQLDEDLKHIVVNQ